MFCVQNFCAFSLRYFDFYRLRLFINCKMFISQDKHLERSKYLKYIENVSFKIYENCKTYQRLNSNSQLRRLVVKWLNIAAAYCHYIVLPQLRRLAKQHFCIIIFVLFHQWIYLNHFLEIRVDGPESANTQENRLLSDFIWIKREICQRKPCSSYLSLYWGVGYQSIITKSDQ